MEWRVLFSANYLVLLVTAGAFVLALSGISVRSSVARRVGNPALLFHWACVLAVLAPIAVALVMVFREHSGRIASLNALNYNSVAEKAVFLAAGVAIYKSFWFVGGLAFLSLAFSGFAGVLFSWRRVNRSDRASALPLIVFGGFSLAELALGIGLLVRSSALMSMYSSVAYADAAEKALLFESGYASASGLMPFVFAALVILGLACFTVLAFVLDGKVELPRFGRWSVAASVVVFVFGASLFASTRYHAADADSLDALFQSRPRAGEILYVDRGIRMPTLLNTQNLSQAPVITASSGSIVAEGKLIARIDELVEAQNSIIADLAEVLDKLKKQYSSLHPAQEFPGRIILYLDRDTPGQAVARILWTCHVVGYRQVQLATDGIFKFPTAVFGDYVRYHPKAIHFELVEKTEGHSIDQPGKEKLLQWANKLDKAAAGGKVVVKTSQPF